MPRAIAFDDDYMGRRRKGRPEKQPARSKWLAVLFRSPIDMLGVVLAAVLVAAITVNALYLQKSRHSSPLFAAVVPLSSIVEPAPAMGPMPRPRPVDAGVRAAAIPAAAMSSRPIAASKMTDDPVGNLIVKSRRISAIQRVLAEYGYAQLRITGDLDTDTRTAIAKFERERKLPVTGQVSDRLLRELAVLSGKTIP